MRAVDIRQDIHNTASSLVSFLRHPTVRVPRHIGPWLPIVPLLTIFAVDISIDVLVGLILSLSEAVGHEPPNQFPMLWSDPYNVVSFLLLAPIIEELQFRGWLNGHRRNLILAALVMPPVYAAYILPYDYHHLLPYLSLAALLLLIGGVFWWRRQAGGAETIPAWFERHFALVLWGSALAFGAIHFTLYSDFEWGLDALYILPQTLGAIMLAFTRLRLGLRAAMVHHALFNGYTGLYDLSDWVNATI
jgi:membrane protease YdiL (CAAX protease family)